jgi:hypothetical protein
MCIKPPTLSSAAAPTRAAASTGGERRTLPRTATLLLVTCLAAALTCPTWATSPQLYRWVDDEGNVHYTDKIPPSAAERGHTELSADGVLVRTVAPAKTPEEIQRERELERLRAEQQRLIDQQQAEDRALLRSFHSADDLIMVRDGKLSEIDAIIQVTKSNIRRQQDWLTQQRAHAAELEKAGEPASDKLDGYIASTERSIKASYQAILEREQQKQAIRDSYARDLKRFSQLREVPEVATATDQAKQTSLLDNLVECNGPADCVQLWQRALDYVGGHATRPMENTGNDVAMTQAPSSIKDIALTVSRIWNKDRPGAVIFLDLQCRSYTASAESCRTEERLAVLNGFRAALEAGNARASR